MLQNSNGYILGISQDVWMWRMFELYERIKGLGLGDDSPYYYKYSSIRYNIEGQR